VSDGDPVAAHAQQVTRRYVIHYPAHPPREGDPHYRDFDAYHRATRATAHCAVGEHRGDYAECSTGQPLELHHAHIEFALQNGVELAWLEKDYPGVSDPSLVGAWVESALNLQWLCVFHHRGHGGAHLASASDYEAEKYIRGLIT
jgi:hypothetical protein